MEGPETEKVLATSFLGVPPSTAASTLILRSFEYGFMPRGYNTDQSLCRPLSGSMNAHKAETAVWGAVSALLTDPESLRRDLEAMIEREKEARSDPKPEAKA
jgi:hypothetical protein